MTSGNNILQAETFFETILAQRISQVLLPTAVFGELTSVQNNAAIERYSAVSDQELAIAVAGEQLRVSDGARRFFGDTRRLRLRNNYGPSETHVCTTYALPADVTMWPASIVAIGRPIANTRIYLLDKYLEPVPFGVAGELYVGGACVGRGYWHRPELTAERFIDSPFVSGDRLYKTGDLARYLADGNIEFLGRNDFQVKIRGFRIELGEIEAHLATHPDVHDAVVLAREGLTGDKQLVAYYTGAPLEAETLRNHLSRVIPDYMVPAAYVRLATMPLTVNGKLDRIALPAPDGQAYARRAYEAPRGATEESLAAIWAEVLGLEQVGRHDNFFEIGGHSLLAVRVCSSAQRTLGVDIRLEDIFLKPTIASLSEDVDTIHLLSTMVSPELRPSESMDLVREL